jgi:hypothetical protein
MSFTTFKDGRWPIITGNYFLITRKSDCYHKVYHIYLLFFGNSI